MGILGALTTFVLVFMCLWPCYLLMSSMWAAMQPAVISQMGGSGAMGANQITHLGNTVFYYMPDSVLVILYFGLIIALFISAIYEQSAPESLPIGLLILIPIILISFPLSDFTHFLYSNPGFANVAQYYTASEYISDWSPLFTSIITVAYLLFLITKKTVFKESGMPSGPGIIGG